MYIYIYIYMMAVSLVAVVSLYVYSASIPASTIMHSLDFVGGFSVLSNSPELGADELHQDLAVYIYIYTFIYIYIYIYIYTE